MDYEDYGAINKPIHLNISKREDCISLKAHNNISVLGAKALMYQFPPSSFFVPTCTERLWLARQDAKHRVNHGFYRKE